MEWTWNILTVFISLLAPMQCFQSSLFRNRQQVEFVASLSDYSIVNPKLSLTRNFHGRRMNWNLMQTVQPQNMFIKLRIKDSLLKIYMTKNVNLLRKDYSLEDIARDHLSSRKRVHTFSTTQSACYYTGIVLQRRDSRVALSTCNGLRGFISFNNTVYYIEPMKQLRHHYLHLVYESRAELNSTHNPKIGRKLTCSSGKSLFHDHTGHQHHVHIGPSDRFEWLPDPVVTETHRISRRSSGLSAEESNSVDSPAPKDPEASKTWKATIEVFVVVDKHMVAFHGNESLQNYVLTMMNMVNDMYREPSLGMDVNMVVAKILILHNDMENLNISHNGDRTLFSFCEWQFLNSLSGNQKNGLDSGLKYDVALLLTRKDVCANSDRPCGTIGLAYINGMCSTNRKCSVVEDIGLNTAYTIAHELGHTLGMTHDGEDNTCPMAYNGFPHMMAAQWPSGNHVGNMKWSECSRKKLLNFMESYKSYCIRESPQASAPAVFDSSRKSNVLPGKLYDADTQCRQQYGGVAKHCQYYKTTGLPTNMCHQLWCEIEEEDECVSKLDPAAKGTPCAPGKWCMYGQCVNNTGIPDPVDGGWSEWSNWTQCSRSCGVGARYIERFCNNPAPRNGGRYCNGDARKYETCHPEACPTHSRDIRILQCEQYNNKTIQYIPVHSQGQPCALHCRPRVPGAHYSVRFQQKVIDGTPCRHGSSDICIDGRCQKLGCDNKLNSKMQKDLCGVCGGNGTTCNLVEGEFTQPLGEGYVTAVDIPEGAKNVIVMEVKPCPSFLALKSGHGAFHVNGNWTIALPGKYDVNGTVVYYKRRGTQEMFYTEGPTKTHMQFMVLFQDFNFGVKYRYTLPLNKTQPKDGLRSKYGKGTFGWMQGPWDDCSVKCGGGIMRRKKARCLFISGQNITIVEDDLCSGAKMPPSPEKTCNEHKCPKVWFVTPWGECSKPCGLGRQKRVVSCKEQLPAGGWKNLTEGCPVAEKPVHIQTCVLKSCFLSWRTGSWSKCRAKCGKNGLKYRSVSCPVAGACLDSMKPAITRACKSPKCEYKWTVDAWSKCSRTCGGGFQVRSVQCREVQSMKIHRARCRIAAMPPIHQKCNVWDCNRPAGSLNTTSLERRPSNSFAEVVTSRIIFRAPRRKRKPILKSILQANNIPPPPPKDTCKRDKLPRWACTMLVSTDNLKKFCHTEKAKEKCCRFCRDFLSFRAPVKIRRHR